MGVAILPKVITALNVPAADHPISKSISKAGNMPPLVVIAARQRKGNVGSVMHFRPPVINLEPTYLPANRSAPKPRLTGITTTLMGIS
jgi:hypothetical protein